MAHPSFLYALLAFSMVDTQISETATTSTNQILDVDTFLYEPHPAVVAMREAQADVVDFRDLCLPQSEYVFDDLERLDDVFDELHERRFEDTRIG